MSQMGQTAPIGRLTAAIAAGPVLSAWSSAPTPVTAGVLAREAFDAVTLDMQHGAVDLSAVTAAIPAIHAAGKPAVVRIPVGEFQTASRVLDLGASGIIGPMVNNVEDARRLAAFTRFPPVGERSWGPFGALPASGLEPGAFLASANRMTLVLAMIETRAALAALDDILVVPGIDGVFVGPADLSIALSDGANVDPLRQDVQDAVGHVVARSRAAGKIAGAFAFSGGQAAAFLKLGLRFIAVENEIAHLRAGARAALAAARGV